VHEDGSQSRVSETSPATDLNDASPESTPTNSVSLLQPYIQALVHMAPTNRETVLNLIQALSKREGVPVAHTSAQCLQLPEQGVPLWISSLKAEQLKERTMAQFQCEEAFISNIGPLVTIHTGLGTRAFNWWFE
jgi:hypothetical protein